ncbi:hypothetical protein ACIHCQ_37765 [Streptomyces sp. NPDC052236]|uniref:hypothetical protein n=1 Tax=Streptomyces sp. NPDC052236 TaxID=3365686 RepID=UPI0037D2D325
MPHHHRLSRRGLLAATVATGQASAAEIPPPDPQWARPPHQVEAEALVDYLRTLPWSEQAKVNRYKAAGVPESSFANWGTAGHPEQFSVLAQCSSFLTMVLERTYGANSAYGWATREYFSQYFGTEPGKLYPTAEKFRTGFAAAADIPHFDAVTKPVNLRPGDLVAFDYDPVNTTEPYTGHIVMVKERKGTWASSSVDSQVGPDVIPYVFEIVDCTSDPHGSPAASDTAEAIYRAFPDTRIEEHVGATPEWTEHNGVGYGHIVFYADATTKLFAGYRWSVNSSKANKVADCPIAAARVYAG